MSSVRKTHTVTSYAAIPAWIPPVVRRFWEFTKKNSKEFAKNLKDPQKREDELLKVVARNFKA